MPDFLFPAKFLRTLELMSLHLLGCQVVCLPHGRIYCYPLRFVLRLTKTLSVRKARQARDLLDSEFLDHFYYLYYSIFARFTNSWRLRTKILIWSVRVCFSHSSSGRCRVRCFIQTCFVHFGLRIVVRNLGHLNRLDQL